ncbi:MAG: SMC-Scp complex subunit ScpB [Promethearchaeota archaeon]
MNEKEEQEIVQEERDNEQDEQGSEDELKEETASEQVIEVNPATDDLNINEETIVGNGKDDSENQLDLDEEENDAESLETELVQVEIRDAEKEKNEFIKAQLEAVLFVAGKPVSPEEVAVKLGISKKLTEKLFEELAFDYLDRNTSLEIAKAGEKYILQLKPEFTNYVKGFAAGGLIREAVMRTLTIIAAKQPILQSQLSKLRSSAGEHIKELLEMGLIKAEPKGRSRELTTTNKFADMFGFSRNISKMKEQIKAYLMGKEAGKEK